MIEDVVVAVLEQDLRIDECKVLEMEIDDHHTFVVDMEQEIHYASYYRILGDL